MTDLSCSQPNNDNEMVRYSTIVLYTRTKFKVFHVISKVVAVRATHGMVS